MTLVRLTEVLSPAAASGTGLGAFNVFSIEHAEALTAAAELAGTPVVLQISQNAVRYHGALVPIALATLALARGAAGPLCYPCAFRMHAKVPSGLRAHPRRSGRRISRGTCRITVRKILAATGLRTCRRTTPKV